MKTFLLLLDGAALAWLLSYLGSGRPILTMQTSPLVFAPFAVLAALGGMIELGFLAFLAMTVFGFRGAAAYQPYGRFLALTQLALAAGLLLGGLFFQGDVPGFGLLLMTVGIVGSVSLLLVVTPLDFLLRRPGWEIPAALVWGAFLFELFVLGAVLRFHPDLAPPFLTGIAAALWLSPLAHLALGFTLGPWLLYPSGWRDVFDHGLSWGTRAQAALLAVSVAVPFGGLIIPWWIYARRQH